MKTYQRSCHSGRVLSEVDAHIDHAWGVIVQFTVGTVSLIIALSRRSYSQSRGRPWGKNMCSRARGGALAFARIKPRSSRLPATGVSRRKRTPVRAWQFFLFTNYQYISPASIPWAARASSR